MQVYPEIDFLAKTVNAFSFYVIYHSMFLPEPRKDRFQHILLDFLLIRIVSFVIADEGALLEYENNRRRIFLRRLSGSESSILLGNGSSNGDRSRLVLRPLTVQQRIRELNLRARHFAETIMAVQLADAVPNPTDGRSALNHHGMSFSLQTSPTHTPSCPIDFTHLASSRYSSMENINSPYSSLEYQGLSSRWRSSRRSLRSPDFSREELNESMEAESERLLDEREAELRKRLQSFEEGKAK